MIQYYDVIVVGGGHAGCEAASAAANLGSNTLLITMDMTKFGQMSCNPAIGGIAKGQIVREIDAMGGYTGIVTDRSMIQFRMLNLSKGPAMWSPRAQCDRVKFSIEWRNILESIKNLDFWQDNVVSLVLEDNVVKGVTTQIGVTFYAKSVILTTGTFDNGLMHIGRNTIVGGRISEPASIGISDQLKIYGFEVGRMKTGTPARLDGRSIDFSLLESQSADETGKFSFLFNHGVSTVQKPCHFVYTSSAVHSILERGFKDSPLYAGIIKGVGPRYCPSIEDKIVTFSSKDSHQLFLEPEGENTNEYYINGFSSSLPWDIQYKALRAIKGLEYVKIFRPGYAIEYDYYPPTQLKHTLETKLVQNLFFAGQINGTTGYEEAAAQGLIAGINAHLLINSKNEFILKRNEAYIGVLIDDLVTKGVDEPYRMFTSRAEYRILLRQDNADERLTEKAYQIGLVQKERYELFLSKKKFIHEYFTILNNKFTTPERINPILERANTTTVKSKSKLIDILSRPQINIQMLVDQFKSLQAPLKSYGDLQSEVLDSIEINIKYSGYIHKEQLIADKLLRLEEIKISDSFDFSSLQSLSTEARIKFKKIKPTTIGQASRIPGVSPSDINVLLIHLGR